MAIQPQTDLLQTLMQSANGGNSETQKNILNINDKATFSESAGFSQLLVESQSNTSPEVKTNSVIPDSGGNNFPLGQTVTNPLEAANLQLSMEGFADEQAGTLLLEEEAVNLDQLTDIASGVPSEEELLVTGIKSHENSVTAIIKQAEEAGKQKSDLNISLEAGRSGGENSIIADMHSLTSELKPSTGEPSVLIANQSLKESPPPVSSGGKTNLVDGLAEIHSPLVASIQGEKALAGSADKKAAPASLSGILPDTRITDTAKAPSTLTSKEAIQPSSPVESALGQAEILKGAVVSVGDKKLSSAELNRLKPEKLSQENFRMTAQMTEDELSELQKTDKKGKQPIKATDNLELLKEGQVKKQFAESRFFARQLFQSASGSVAGAGEKRLDELTNLQTFQQTVQTHLPISPIAVAKASEASVDPVVMKAASGTDFSQGLSLKQNFTPNLALRIQWMFKQALSSAEIMMDPPEMGPLSVKVQQHNGETSILFQVANATTRDALDENLPKLKEMLEQQGINLGEAQVQHQKKESADSEQSDEQLAAQNSDAVAEAIERDDVAVLQQTDRLVDVYS